MPPEWIQAVLAVGFLIVWVTAGGILVRTRRKGDENAGIENRCRKPVHFTDATLPAETRPAESASRGVAVVRRASVVGR